jgi:hypothetical protein
VAFLIGRRVCGCGGELTPRIDDLISFVLCPSNHAINSSTIAMSSTKTKHKSILKESLVRHSGWSFLGLSEDKMANGFAVRQ